MSPSRSTLPGPRERRAMKEATRAQQRAMKEQLHAQTAALKNNPQFVEAQERAKRRRRRRQLALLVLILILLLLRLDCTCGPPAPVPPPEPPPPAEVTPPDKPPVVKKRRVSKRKPPKLEGKVDKSDREGMEVKPPPPPSWLGQFRLQVAARSPKLAACFEGNEKPGALRWSALVHAKSGKVTASSIEPAFRGAPLSERQAQCLIKGLTDVPYNLTEPDDSAAPRRVSIIFEF